jgi:cell volume regulation protein A
MQTAILVTICILILLAYTFDLSSKHTKIPTVILLLALGWGLQLLSRFLGINVPDLEPLLPIFGTIGLILIVLEGGLELQINASKKKVLRQTSLSAFIPLIILLFAIGFAINYLTGAEWMNCIINAIPFCIISSAIAIPSVHHLREDQREFVIYESSLSDIFGVIVFNFLVIDGAITLMSFWNFLLQTILMLAISLFASIGLAYLIKRIDHTVKFLPIIMIVVLIYAVSKEYHLPALIFILLFGLFLNNLDELKRFSFIKKLEPQKLDLEVHKFKEVVSEFTFLVRTIFFLLFGFLIEVKELLHPHLLMFAAGIVGAILIVRTVQLKIAKMPLLPLLFVAPRGLITILLFISIPVARQIPMINKSLMIQVILLSALVMMFGFLFKKDDPETQEN